MRTTVPIGSVALDTTQVQQLAVGAQVVLPISSAANGKKGDMFFTLSGAITTGLMLNFVFPELDNTNAVYSLPGTSVIPVGNPPKGTTTPPTTQFSNAGMVATNIPVTLNRNLTHYIQYYNYTSAPVTPGAVTLNAFLVYDA